MHQLDMLTEIMLKHQNADREARIQQRYQLHMVHDQRRVSLYRPLLAGLGRRLVVWGTQLQRSNDTCYPVREVTFVRSSK